MKEEKINSDIEQELEQIAGDEDQLEEWYRTHTPDKKSVEEACEELEEEDAIQRMHNFYFLKKNKQGDIDIVFNMLGVVNKMRSLGYYRFDQPNGSFEYVYIKDNKIEIIPPKMIRDGFEDYIRQLPDCDKVTDNLQMHVTSYMILNKLYQNNIGTVFSEQNFERLRPLRGEIKLLHDSHDEKYFFFKNTVLCVTKKGALEIPYDKIRNGAIMANSIINRNYDSSYIWADPKSDWYRFCSLVSGQNPKRLLSLMSILGYLMHDNYETDLRAAYFTDVNMDNSHNAAGGTGKGLIGFALSYMLNRNSQEDKKYIAIPGKNFCATEPKRYAAADISTQLIHVQDLTEKFKFGDMYNDITDGATFQKHYQNPIYRRVKIMLSMNQAMKLQGSSDKRRIVVFELANFFSEKLRPENYFGHRFFGKDWGEQWHYMDAFMVECERLYLQEGIIEPEIINLDKRAIIETVGENLYWWLQDETRFGCEPNERKLFSKASLYTEFSQKYPGEFPTQRMFTEACVNYLTMMNIRSSVWRDGTDWYILYPSEQDYTQRKLQRIV